MTPKMTVRRLVALQDAANNPTGRISPRLVSISDERALEDLGYADSICEHGHVLDPEDRDGTHKGCKHFFAITKMGRSYIGKKRNKE